MSSYLDRLVMDCQRKKVEFTAIAKLSPDSIQWVEIRIGDVGHVLKITNETRFRGTEMLMGPLSMRNKNSEGSNPEKTVKMMTDAESEENSCENVPFRYGLVYGIYP